MHVDPTYVPQIPTPIHRRPSVEEVQQEQRIAQLVEATLQRKAIEEELRTDHAIDNFLAVIEEQKEQGNLTSEGADAMRAAGIQLATKGASDLA